ncbi:sugar phosphate isomerase/epimerase family protein [Paenibacillus sp. HB172176]|uniref:sugar phosphate isomerase/epimerase family protein n=1 Tax=Paenibacillus sp. HB172176 TaxID=2493690 RepID=UPI0014389472|nr:sugar phosphate isomerase/epimerase family protein [Paenibacillus sp. HB172176]
MSPFLLTCFADEISSDLNEQLDVLEQEGFRHLEIRKLWDKNVLELSSEELTRLGGILKDRGFAVSSIASPIGKYPVTSPFEPQLQAMERAMAAAHALETPNIRIFSCYLPENEPREAYRDEVLYRMKRLTEAAERGGVTLLLENDNDMYGSNYKGGMDIIEHCQSPAVTFAFDAGNYVLSDVEPMGEAYPVVAEHIGYVHIKDAIREPRQFVPAGVGQGKVEELIVALNERGFSGFLSVEPHMHKYLPNATDPERVRTAIHALTSILAKHRINWK